MDAMTARGHVFATKHCRHYKHETNKKHPAPALFKMEEDQHTLCVQIPPVMDN